LILRSAHTYKKLEQLGGDPSKLDIPKQTVAVLYSVQAIIDSGGFLYLFENDFPLNPPYSQFVDAYRRLGSNEAAVRLEKAVAMFPFKDPHITFRIACSPAAPASPPNPHTAKVGIIITATNTSALIVHLAAYSLPRDRAFDLGARHESADTARNRKKRTGKRDRENKKRRESRIERKRNGNGRGKS